MWRDHLNKDLLEIVLRVLLPELIERAFSEELTGLDDADGIAELFDFAHNMSGEDDGLAVVAAFADKSGDGAGGHDIKDERAGYGSFLLHARGQFVAASVAKTVHVQAVEDVVNALVECGLVEAVETAEVFD